MSEKVKLIVDYWETKPKIKLEAAISGAGFYPNEFGLPTAVRMEKSRRVQRRVEIKLSDLHHTPHRASGEHLEH